MASPVRGLVFNTKTPHSTNTFLVDGRVAGTWAADRGRVGWRPFEPPARARRELDEEAGELERSSAENPREGSRRAA